MAQTDISDLLKDWPYDPDQNIRRIQAADGTEKLQVRQPLGIEQYELDGRPDGRRPEGYESYLHLIRARLDAQEAAQRRLSPEDCFRLTDEGLLYYFRYLVLFQVGEYDRVLRDTRRNLRMFDLVHEYAERAEDKVQVDQYRPYLIRIAASARAMKLAKEGETAEARRILTEAVRQIEQLEDVPSPVFEFERQRSVPMLKQIAETIGREEAAPSEREQLLGRLRQAIEQEDYERAAKLRDAIREMEEKPADNTGAAC